ncbi:MAG: thioesterase family protein [Bdellovibrionota bacterium]
MSNLPIKLQRQVHFYETDAMKVVHHTNYLRYFEEGRVAWGFDRGIISLTPGADITHLAVLDIRARYLKPLIFADKFEITVQAKLERLRLTFQYRLIRDGVVTTVGESVHVPLGEDLKLKPWNETVKNIFRSEAWTETWL